MTAADSMEVLVDLERAGWEALSGGDPEGFYDEVLTDHAVMVFPFGAMGRAEAIASMASAPPWDEFTIEHAQVHEVAAGVATLAYRVRARRGEDDTYEAMLTSTYVDEGGQWRLALHQQSP